jgi:hypothetical protein
LLCRVRAEGAEIYGIFAGRGGAVCFTGGGADAIWRTAVWTGAAARTLFAIPFITNVVMFGVKWLAGLAITDNGSQP